MPKPADRPGAQGSNGWLFAFERRQAAAIGEKKYDDFKQTLRAVVDSLTLPADVERWEMR